MKDLCGTLVAHLLANSRLEAWKYIKRNYPEDYNRARFVRR